MFAGKATGWSSTCIATYSAIAAKANAALAIGPRLSDVIVFPTVVMACDGVARKRRAADQRTSVNALPPVSGVR